jgi:hypothetical protein
VGSKLWKLLSQASGEKVTKSNFHSVLKYQARHLAIEPESYEELGAFLPEQPQSISRHLESQETKESQLPQGLTAALEITDSDIRVQESVSHNQHSVQNLKSTIQNRADWSEAIDVSAFDGRTEELATLEQWIVKDRCRLVALFGMGGIGKTALAAKIAEQVQGKFEYLIWRSLRNAPPVQSILTELLYFLSGEQSTDVPETLDSKISRLVDYLRQHQCLLILDNAEAILRSGDLAGRYREGYEGYGQLLRWVGEARHQSCLLLTSREKPTGIASKEGTKLPIRSLQLTGLKQIDAQKIIGAKSFIYGSEEEWTALVEYYAGNPLALKIVSTTIQELFDSNISKFLNQGTKVYGDICHLLDQQFNRLSDLEKQIMYWLKTNSEWTSLSELLEDIMPPAQQRKLLEALESLRQRSLIEKNKETFIQQPFVMEYMIERLDRTAHEKDLHNLIALQLVE